MPEGNFAIYMGESCLSTLQDSASLPNGCRIGNLLRLEYGQY